MGNRLIDIRQHDENSVTVQTWTRREIYNVQPFDVISPIRTTVQNTVKGQFAPFIRPAVPCFPASAGHEQPFPTLSKEKCHHTQREGRQERRPEAQNTLPTQSGRFQRLTLTLSREMWNKQILERAAGWREKAGIFLLKKFWTAGFPKNFREWREG